MQRAKFELENLAHLKIFTFPPKLIEVGIDLIDVTKNFCKVVNLMTLKRFCKVVGLMTLKLWNTKTFL